MRRRILLLVVGMTTLAVLAFAIPIAILIHANAGQKAEQSTRDQADSIAVSLRTSSRTAAQLTSFVALQKSNSGRQVSIRLPDGTFVGSTPGDQIASGLPGGFSGAPRYGYPQTDGATATATPPGGGDAGGGPAPQLISVPNGVVAVAFARTQSGQGGYLVRVYLADSQRYSGQDSQFLLVGGAVLALIALGVVAGEILTRRIARPLVETARTAQQLSHGDTTARAPTNGPTEVADVGRALNRLADRIDQLIAEERETVADVSHRLRTPLTALRLDAEALKDPVDAERVGNHVTTLERMLTAVIHAARRPQREGRMPASDARAVVAERIAFWSALAEDQDRTGTVSLPAEPLPVRAGAEDLSAAVDALLENVIAHTPEGTDFAVTLVATSVGARLTVSDDGPGLLDQAVVRGRSDRGSTGLGLDIARRCAESSGGSLSLGSSPSGGASITLELAAP